MIGKIREKIPFLKRKHGRINKEDMDYALRVASSGGNKEKYGWVSPEYSLSRRVYLDPKKVSENRCMAAAPDHMQEMEAYRVLRTQIMRRTQGENRNTIMVTSANAHEGKTLTAINLAFTFAREYQQTALLVDGDLKNQSIHKYLGYAGSKGLVEYLVDGVLISDLIAWPGIEKITLISGGRPCQNSAEMLGSPRMKELISDIKGRYSDRTIIFDVPSVLSGADALIFAPLVDYIIIVVQAGKTSMDDVRKTIQFLPKDKILGFVLNRCELTTKDQVNH